MSSKVCLTCMFKLNFLFASCINRHMTVLLGSGCSHSFRGILSKLVLAIVSYCRSNCPYETYYGHIINMLEITNSVNRLKSVVENPSLVFKMKMSRRLAVHAQHQNSGSCPTYAWEWAEAHLSVYGWALHCFSILLTSPCRRLSVYVFIHS